MVIVQSCNANDLCNQLRSINIRVPPRAGGTGNRKKCVELYTICRFLATFAESRLFEFPLKVEDGERPDIVISIPSGCIGIEIVEAIPQNQAGADAYAENKKYNNLMPIPDYRPGEPKRSRKEINQIASGKYRVLPRMGNAIEITWSKAMFHFLMKKVVKFQSPNFRKFRQNWLLIDDNWSPAPALEDEEIAADFLQSEIANRGSVNPFDRIFVLRSQTIWTFGHKCRSLARLNDLWR